MSYGRNLTKEENDPTAHAEVVAIRKACKVLGSKYLEGGVLYTNSEPCFMCFIAAVWAHIEKIVYNKSRKELLKVTYHTRDFNIHDLNAHFDKPLEIIELEI